MEPGTRAPSVGEGRRGLSWVTWGYLFLYALLVLHHLVFRYAPGELLRATPPEPFKLDGRELVTVFPVVPEAEWLLAGVRPGGGERGGLWLLNGLGEGRVPLRKTPAVWMPLQALMGEPLRYVARNSEDDLTLYSWPEGAAPEAKPLPDDFLWLREEGSAVVAGDVAAALAERAFGPVYPAPAALAMNLALVRPAIKSWADPKDGPKGGWAPKRSDFIVFDRETLEPLGYVKTLPIIALLKGATTGFPGFLYLADTGRTLHYVYCGEDGSCGGHRDQVYIGFDYERVRAASYRGEFDRIAVCTEGHLWLYRGSPEAREGNVLLGRTALACNDVFIIDARTVIACVDEAWRRVRFEGELP